MRIAVSTLRRLGLMGLLSVAVFAAAASPSAAAGPAVPSIGWQSCGSDFPKAECATVTVPLDYDQPSRARHSWRSRGSRRPTPSRRSAPSSSIPAGRAVRASAWSSMVSARSCTRTSTAGSTSSASTRAASAAPTPSTASTARMTSTRSCPGSPCSRTRAGQYRPFFDAPTLASGPGASTTAQRIAAHMSTADVARDLDLLRQAVGDRKLTYLGFSYGTLHRQHLRQPVPRQGAGTGHRRRPRSAAVVRAAGRSGPTGSRRRQSSTSSCACATKPGRECAFGTGEGRRQRWERLAQAHRARSARPSRRLPLHVRLPDRGRDRCDVLARGLGRTRGRRGASRLPRRRVARRPDAEAAALRRRCTAALAIGSRHPPEADYDNGLDAYYGNQCADTEYPRTFPVARDRSVRASRVAVRALWWWFNTGCADGRSRLTATSALDGADVGAGPRRRQLLRRRHRLHRGPSVNQLLANSRLLSYAGWGHTAYGRNDCTTAHVDAYLVGGTLPRAGTVCQANPNPFLSVPAALTAPSNHVAGAPPAGS